MKYVISILILISLAACTTSVKYKVKNLRDNTVKIVDLRENGYERNDTVRYTTELNYSTITETYVVISKFP